MARPILKWAGGKTQLLPQLLPLFPTEINTLYEPFIGGGAVFFYLATEGRFDRAVINDWNSELTNLYSVVRDCPDALIEKLQLAKSQYLNDPEGTYYRWRALDRANLMGHDQATRTILLNKAGFNGLYRQNKKGGFNVPWGKHMNPPICDEQNLRECFSVLQGVEIRTGDFVDGCKGAGKGDLVYFDPPYLPLTDTANFSAYTSDGFSMGDHLRLAETFKSLVAAGATCVLSNHDVPAVHEMFHGFEIIQVPVKRNINSKGDKRGPVREVIVVGRPYT